MVYTQELTMTRNILVAALLIINLISTSFAEDISPREVLKEALNDYKNNNYDNALDKYIWLHNDSLKHKPNFYSVRLTFAIAYWVELAKKYPKAKKALFETRDKKTNLIMSNNGNLELYRDVHAINKYLEESDKTIKLFIHLHQSKEGKMLANVIYPYIQTELVEHQKYKICDSYLKDPIDTANKYITVHKKNMATYKNKDWAGEEYLRSINNSFINDIATIIEILKANNRNDELNNVIDFATNYMQSKQLDDKIKMAILKANS